MIIEIKNFQSIEDISFEIPEKKFTCLVGPTNIGKSSLRRALECALYNKSEISYIRNGTKECSVRVKFDDGLDILWSRDKKTAKYEVNGLPYSKLNKSVPQEIIDRGFYELEINKEKLNVQVANQHKHIFLLNENGGKVTDAFSNLGNLNKIITANKSCTSDLKKTKDRLSLRKEDYSTLTEKIDSFSGLDEYAFKVNELKSLLVELNNKKLTLKDLIVKKSQLEKIGLRLKALLPIRKISIQDINIDISLLEKLNIFNNKYINVSYKIEKFNNLKSLNIPEVNFDLELLLKLKKDLHLLIKSKDILLKYKNIPETLDHALDLEESIIKLKKVLALFNKYFYSQKVMLELKNIPESDIALDSFNIDSLNKVKDLYSKVLVHKKKFISLKDDLSNKEQEQFSLEKEYSEIMAELKVCPICGTSLCGDKHV